jgi:hypothetical protein
MAPFLTLHLPATVIARSVVSRLVTLRVCCFRSGWRDSSEPNHLRGATPRASPTITTGHWRSIDFYRLVLGPWTTYLRSRREYPGGGYRRFGEARRVGRGRQPGLY